jgi:uncharacterized SAM-binding protein YcdF (DUF218 family)
MFFILSKLIAPLLSPLNFIFLLLGAGGGLYLLRCRRAARVLIGAGIALYLVFGFLPLGYDAMVWLESRHPRPEAPAHVDGILVLGGSLETRTGATRNVLSMNDRGERVLEGLALARRYPYAVLVYSGGNNSLRGGADNPETTHVEALLTSLGVDPMPVFFEEESRNTYENIVNSIRLAQPQPDETWLLVTSAWHMPRAAAIAHSVGWPSRLVYWPVDYRTDGVYRALPQKLEVGKNFDNLSLSLHEGLGWLTYRLTGRINPRGEGLDK